MDSLVCLFFSELAGGSTEAHRRRGAAGDLRGQNDGSRRRPSLSNPGERRAQCCSLQSWAEVLEKTCIG